MPEGEGLRPTPDRIRETLFNWLTLDVPGAQVLDCFAGAGGLGLEAASREARQVTLVEKDRSACTSLRQQCQRLGAQNVQVIQQDITQFLAHSSARYDLVFIDPPYALGYLRDQVLTLLLENNLLNDKAFIYLEWPGNEAFHLKQAELTWLKQKNAAAVCYGLAQCRVSG